MLSLVSNAEVRRQAGVKKLSQQLLATQMLYYGRLASMDNHSALRNLTLEPLSAKPKCLLGKRKIGRPRLTWATLIYAHCLAAVGHDQEMLYSTLCTGIGPTAEWRNLIEEYVDIAGH